MKTTKQMAVIISRIATRAGINLDEVGAHIKILKPPYMPLCIEVIGKNLVSVAHYYEQNQDLVADPDMVFYTGYGLENGWVPVSIQISTGYYTEASIIKYDQIESFYSDRQQEQATFANKWATNLRQQGFLAVARAIK